MDFRLWLEVKGIDHLLEPETPPGIVADWLDDHGYHDQELIAKVRAGVTIPDIQEAAENAVEPDFRQLTNVYPPTNHQQSRKVQWKSKDTRNWWSVELMCNPSHQPIEAPAGIFIRKFGLSWSAASQGATAYWGDLDQISRSKYFKDYHISQEGVVKTGLLLWALIVGRGK